MKHTEKEQKVLEIMSSFGFQDRLDPILKKLTLAEGRAAYEAGVNDGYRECERERVRR